MKQNDGRARGASVGALVALALVVTPAAARPEDPRPSAPGQLVLTVTGGVSLGAYEAGVLYYATQSARLNPGQVQLRAATGASAGSLNSLLAVLTTCGAPAASPEQSVFWQTWIPLGLRELYVPADTTPLGALSRPALEDVARRVEASWNAGISEQCDVVLGVSTTRLEPRVVRVASERLELPRMEDKFVLRIRGRGPGRPPLATNYVDPHDRFGPRLLVTAEDGSIAFAEVRDLLLASMAFPVAFPPVPLASCAVHTGHGNHCRAEDAEVALHVDGGVLDNAPLRLAVRLAGAGLRPGADGSLAWRDEPRKELVDVPDGVLFGFLTPDLTDHPVYEPVDAADATHSIVTLLSRLTTGFISTARAKELAAVAEERPELVGQMVPPQRHFPAASAPLGAFLGFFEREFRVFDFYLGMYDARRLYDDALRTRMPRPGPPEVFVYPDAFGDVSGGEGSWRPFACLRAMFDDDGSPDERCAGEGLREFRILARASLEVLYSDCRTVRTGGETNAHCQRARAGHEPPAVSGVDEVGADSWVRAEREADLAYRLRLLASHRFTFADLGLRADQGGQALARIRRDVGAIAAGLAEAQPADDRALVGFGAKAAADAIAYEPPARVVHLVLGPVPEIGLSQRLAGLSPRWGTLRAVVALGTRGLEHLASSGAHEWAWSAVGGVEVQPTWRAGLSQLRIGARAGYEFSSGDGMGTHVCDAVGSTEPGACSRFVVQGLAAVSLLERLRFQVVGSWYPSLRQRQRAVWSISPAFGIEFGF